MVPKSHDVILSNEEEKALWQTCFTAAPARRREVEPSFPKVERKDQRPGPALRSEPHDRHKMAISHNNHRCAHGVEPAQEHSALICRGGSHRGVPAKNPAAPG